MSDLTSVSHVHEDAEYNAFLQRMSLRFLTGTNGPLFTTDAEGLWDAYLQSLPQDLRQYHNCHACRTFINRFGALARIDADNAVQSAIWNPDEAPELYRPGIEAMARLARRGKITGVFLSTMTILGQPRTGEWTHFWVQQPAAMVYKRGLLTAGQAMAEKREDFKTVVTALEEFSLATVEQALTLLKSDALYRSEKVLGQAQWLYDLHLARNVPGMRSLAVWKAIATAPAGFCHPRTSMIGTLLEDIADGFSTFDDVARKFKAKMHPLRYQRPQAAPAAGNIAQAEKVFAELGLAAALERRIARIDEVPKVWEPKPQEPTSPNAGGVFGHLKPKEAQPVGWMQIPAITVTLEKFVRTVIPTAEAIEVFLGARIAAIAITTAVNADAPKLFQWDHQFSHYCWHGGSTPGQYGLNVGSAKVAGITRLPSRWNDEHDGKHEHQGDGIILLLDGARESREAGNALLPEHLRSELHGVRSTIEAYSRSAKMGGLADGSAIGIDIRKGHGGSYPVTVRVTADGRAQDYKIDRWD